MNVQVEINKEEHTARLIVSVDVERLDVAKKKAARNISRRVNIPGFRKGKVPYNILVKNGLESQIIMDAIDSLGQEIYREALETSQLDPYGPGSFDDYELEPSPVFFYSLPLEPEITLNDYRSVRVEYTSSEISDEAVDDYMQKLLEQNALVEESHHPIAEGNRVIVDLHSEFADDPSETATTNENSNDDADKDNPEDAEDDEYDDLAPPAKGDTFIHQHEVTLLLDRENEPILPGFIDALIGAEAGDTVEFELNIPEDDEDYEEEIAGRLVRFSVDIHKVETITLPELTDDFAARVTEDEEQPLTLLELRMRIRENLQQDLDSSARQTYANRVLEEMVKVADIAYPEAMVEEQIDSMIKDLEERLKGQGLDIETYYKLLNTDRQQLGLQYRAAAVATIERGLVMRELVTEEKIRVTEEAIKEGIDLMLNEFGGEQTESLRALLDTPAMRMNIASDIIQKLTMARIMEIGEGKAPDLDALEAEAQAEAEATPTETDETTAEASDITTADAPTSETTPSAEAQTEAEQQHTQNAEETDTQVSDK